MLTSRLVLLCFCALSFSLVIAFRGVGVLTTYFLCILAIPVFKKYYSPLPIKSKYLIWGQLVVPLAVLAIALFFNTQPVLKTAAENLADWSWFKMPADRVILALSGNDEAYSALRAELNKPVWYRELYLKRWTAIYISAYAALVWFGVMLPVVFCRCLQMPSEAAALSGVTDVSRTGFLSCLLIYSVMISVPLFFDGLFLPSSRWILIGPFVSLHLPLFGFLAMVPALVVRKNHLDFSSSIGDFDVEN